jgi:hypothetical protein
MNIKNCISPIPQKFELLERNDVILGIPGEAFYSIDTTFSLTDELAKSALKLLNDTLSRILNVCSLKETGNVKIILTISNAPAGVKNQEQAYSIDISNNVVKITGFGSAGLYYGILTLKQCLVFENNVLRLPCLKILDWPDLNTRGHFMESRFGSNLMELNDWKYLVDHMASMKMNQLVVSVYGCWCVQYDGKVSEYMYVPIKKYPKLRTPVTIRYYSPKNKGWIDKEKLPPMFEQDFFGELIAYGKTKGITVFPLINSYGHNTLIPAQYPEVSAIDEIGEPSLTGFCTSNPKTYELLFGIYDEIIDRYLVPNEVYSFHIGLDEVWDGLAKNAKDIFKNRSPWCKCPECSKFDRKTLFINHAIKILKHLKARGMKNIYMYHDMLIGHGKRTTGDGAEDMIKALNENNLTDNVVIDWWTYSDFKDKLMFQTTRPDLGFRRTVKPWNGYYHWTLLTNPLPNIYLLAKMGNEENVEGMQSYSAWDESYDRNHNCQANFAWNFNGTESIGLMTNRYILKNFGSQYDKASRAFELIDLITETRNETNKDGTPVISKHDILLRTLSYYFYSYVRIGNPYPRIFPGEALSVICSNRKYYLREINEIASMAKEALELLNEVAMDPKCNVRLAKRFGYEVNNYLCLSKDYIALCKMIDITNDKSISFGEKIEKIKFLASQRKLARLALMALLEDTKEEFLFASHMRNHTIFMQFFADLEGYLVNTKPSDIKLDFFDMRYLESEAFKKLR